MSHHRLQILTYFIIIYMLIAFSWWSILLYVKNGDAFQAKSELLEIRLVADRIITTHQQFHETAQYQTLKSQYQKQENMIFGEAIFLVLTLLGGMYIVHRAYQKEVATSNQQRNFLLSITHELKSPIASVRLILETFEKRSQKLSPNQLTELAQNGVQESERLNNLVENLLLSTKLEAAYEIQPEDVNAINLIEPIIERFRKHYPEAKIDLNINPATPTIYGDRMGLVAVIQNLLENALKYSPSPAKISLTIQPSGDEKLSIEIKDEGIGIDKKEQALIFEKFYRIGSEETRRTKGTGLGLFIVAQIVKTHGGTIKLQSGLPKGSIFTIELPQATTF